MSRNPNQRKIRVYWCIPLIPHGHMVCFDSSDDRDAFVEAAGELMITGTKRLTQEEYEKL